MADNGQSKDPNGPDVANSSGYTPTLAGPPPPPYTSYPPGPHGPHGPPHHGPPIQVTTVVPGMIIHQTVGPDAVHTTCRSCGQNVVTRVERRSTMSTHIFAALLCLFGCWPCVCIPYCMESCLNTDHYCSNCGALIGTYMR